MVKYSKGKFKTLDKKIAKNKKTAAASEITNKVLKKKLNAEKKIKFQKEILLQEAIVDGKYHNELVKNVSANDINKNKLSENVNNKTGPQVDKSKPKPLEKRKKRQKTDINDTKLLIRLMKKK